ncbi:MAG: divalent-cation tolerance protein CutA [Longimicrobiales bacterium]|nr:divalent-cation tolerance protein CutA [Longimicrobiales bacterium]
MSEKTDSTTRVVLVTAPDPAVAESLVRRLVEDGVVACGNILPGVTSIYRWQGAVEHDREALIVFKTTAAGARRLVERVPELHPYEVPEVLVLPVEGGHAPYLDWVRENVSSRE